MLVINMTQEQQIIIANNNTNTTTNKLKLGKFARLRLRHHQLRTVSPMNNTQSCNCEHGNMMTGEEASVGDNYQETAGAPAAAADDDLAKNVIFINVVANYDLSHEKANDCAKIDDGDDDQLQLHTKHNGHQPAQELECKLATNELDEHNENLRKLPSPPPPPRPRLQTFYSCCHQSPTESSARHHTQSSHKKDENNDEQRIGKQHPIEQQEQHKYSDDHNHRLPTLAVIAAVDDRNKCRPINMLCPSSCSLANSSPRLKNLLFLISLIVSIQVYHQLTGTNVGATLINDGAGSSSKHFYSTSLFDSNNDNNYHNISNMNVEQTGLLVGGDSGLVDAANDLLATIYLRGVKMMMIKPPPPPPTNYNGDGGDQTTSSNKKEQQRNDDDEEHTQFKSNDDQSRRSDVDCSRLSSSAATVACGSRFANRRKRQPTGADCNKLTASWIIIQLTYPTLARRLLDWAGAIAARAQHDRNQTPLAWVRRLGHQLEEAEQLVAGGELIAQLHQHHNQNQQQQTSPSAAWLARVSSRPGYARLLQQLRTKHVYQKPRSSGTTQSDASLPPADATATDSGHIEASHQLDGHSAAGSHAFGKIIQYPHEISTGGSGDNDDGDNVDPLGGVAQTFEKLRLLNRHNRLQQQSEQQQQQLQLHNQDTQPNEIEQQQLQQFEQPEFERNNKIPAQQSLGADVFHLEQQQQPNWKKALELADSARSRIVYGNVLLQPINKQINDHQLKHQGSVENLHELANHERISGHDSNNNNTNKNSNHHTLTTSGGGEHMVEGGNGGQKSASQQQLTAGQLITASQTIAAAASLTASPSPAPPSSPLPQLIRPKFNEEPTETSNRAFIGSMSNPFGSDSELISQQQAEQMAANDADQLDGNEFEGTFQSRPLDKVAEVHQLRSLSTPLAIVGDHNGNHQHQQRMENDRQLSPAKNLGNSFVVD